MDDRHRVSTPEEGLGTLVAKFSFLQFDKAVAAARDLRSQGTPETEIRETLKASYADLDEHTRLKIYQISLGLQPRDDIASDQIRKTTQIKPTTIEVEVSECPAELLKGTVIFVDGKRWVIISRQPRKLTLKHF